LPPLTLVFGTRTLDSLVVQWAVPGQSSVDILGYRVLINSANSNAIPSIVVYNGENVDNLF
jgi:hypothetical protein